MEYDLLQKTELRFEQIHIQGANLNDVAAVVADVLNLDSNEVLVIDAINNTLAKRSGTGGSRCKIAKAFIGRIMDF